MITDLPKALASTVQGRLVSRGLAERIPLQADIEIIGTCNFKCVHCYIAPVAAREDVMSVEQAKILFDKLSAAGTMRLLLTGGEILTHPQFKQIYLMAKSMGFLVAINTNAYLIGERWADFFAENPPQVISISIYGMTPESYEKVTGIPRSYERCIRAVDLLLERGLKLDLKCPAFSLTHPELPIMQKFAADRGIEFRYDSMMTPRRDGDEDPMKFQLDPDRALELQKVMDPGLTQLREFSIGRVGNRPGATVYQCGAGKALLAINVHGGVTTCTTSRMVVGNLLDQPFDEVWAALGGKVAKKFPEGHPCGTCKFRPMCAGCPALVEQQTGLPDGYVQEYCKLTHLRAKELGYHETGVPMTVTSGIPTHVKTPRRSSARALPVFQ
jgi:radical SAM protein with 4Fe4S-binding SPASM domain